jgi:hypothetical protein
MTTEFLPPIDVDKLRWDSITAQWQQRFNALLHNEKFIVAANRHNQVGIVCRTLREDEDEPRVPLSVIADFFGIGKGNVHWQKERYRDVVRKWPSDSSPT